MTTPTPPAPSAEEPAVVLLAPVPSDCEEILRPEALDFLALLARTFRPRLAELLEARQARRLALEGGSTLDFLAETAGVRADPSWRVAPIPKDLARRAVEITGPVDRKMIINALNSGADVFMADFEDATSPTWENVVRGQRNIRDAVRREITFHDSATGKSYHLRPTPATMVIRPRGLHLVERHLLVDGRPIPASLFDFGLLFFHNASELLARGSGPYYYLPKLESHTEARLWNDVFTLAEKTVGVPHGSVRATVLVETLPAAFEMEEILYELREHSGGLNCGRWDYIFSCIKTRRHDPDAVYPDRAQVTMTQPAMRAYARLAIATCHRRGAHAIGGMSAFIPVRDDTSANERAFAQVRADKLREVGDGHDGTWVAHPGLVPVAREVFAAHMPGPNQIDRPVPDERPSAADILAVPAGTRTIAGLRHNVRVGIQYIEAWLRGIGAVPIYNLMEDAATAEISRAQVWQWIHHAVPLDDGQPVTVEGLRGIVSEELATIRGEIGAPRYDAGRFPEAAELFIDVATAEPMHEFLTSVAYERL